MEPYVLETFTENQIYQGHMKYHVNTVWSVEHSCKIDILCLIDIFCSNITIMKYGCMNCTLSQSKQ